MNLNVSPNLLSLDFESNNRALMGHALPEISGNFPTFPYISVNIYIYFHIFETKKIEIFCFFSYFVVACTLPIPENNSK